MRAKIEQKPEPKPAAPEFHLPNPSFWPIIAALGITLTLAGLAVTLVGTGLGLVIFALAMTGWIVEPAH